MVYSLACWCCGFDFTPGVKNLLFYARYVLLFPVVVVCDICVSNPTKLLCIDHEDEGSIETDYCYYY